MFYGASIGRFLETLPGNTEVTEPTVRDFWNTLVLGLLFYEGHKILTRYVYLFRIGQSDVTQEVVLALFRSYFWRIYAAIVTLPRS